MGVTNVDELERLARAATPGPWKYEYYREDIHSVFGPQSMSWPHGYPIVESDYTDEPNAKYIASANPEAILALIAELRALRRVADEATTLTNFCEIINVEHTTKNYEPVLISSKQIDTPLREALAEWRKLGGGE